MRARAASGMRLTARPPSIVPTLRVTCRSVWLARPRHGLRDGLGREDRAPHGLGERAGQLPEAHELLEGRHEPLDRIDAEMHVSAVVGHTDST